MRKTQGPQGVAIRRRWVGLALLPLLLMYGCSSMNNTEKGAVAGGAIGAGTGALIGAAAHNPALGAVAGGAIGAGTGAIIGNNIDRSEKQQAQIAAANANPPLTLEGVASLAQQHVSDPIIIQQIRSTGSVYHLTPEQISWLKASGVSDGVVMEMQATAYRPVRRVYVSEPAYAAPVYQPVYVAPPPPPEPSIGVGVGIGIRR